MQHKSPHNSSESIIPARTSTRHLHPGKKEPMSSASVEDAVGLFGKLPDARIETRYIDETDGYTLAAPVMSKYDIPGFDRSTKDGYAVNAAETRGATPEKPVELHFSGSIQNGYTDSSFKQGTCMAIATGGALPSCSDAVVMYEHATIQRICVEIQISGYVWRKYYQKR